MTHTEIYKKFMIEYDKANITSSYPSLTQYEVATILDKAYLALIAQKVTGNNVRKATLESDIKSISDLSPLIKTAVFVVSQNPSQISPECCLLLETQNGDLEIKDEVLYFVSAFTYIDNHNTTPSGVMNDVDYTQGYTPMDGIPNPRMVPITITTHQIVQKLFPTSNNVPIIKNPICYFEGRYMFLLVDPFQRIQEGSGHEAAFVTYVKTPTKFVTGNIPIFSDEDAVEFELNNSMAEELISLAISYALENVESTRLNAHLGMRGLEG